MRKKSQFQVYYYNSNILSYNSDFIFHYSEFITHNAEKNLIVREKKSELWNEKMQLLFFFFFLMLQAYILELESQIH